MSPVQPLEAWHSIEMPVAAHDRESVLAAQRSNPDVIRGELAKPKDESFVSFVVESADGAKKEK